LAFALVGGLLFEAAPRAFADIETAEGYEASEQAEETVPVEPSAPERAGASDGAETLNGAGSPEGTGSSDGVGTSGSSEGAGSSNGEGQATSPDAVAQSAAASSLRVALSEPVMTQSQGEALYTSTLAVGGIDAFFGYQLRIATPPGATVTIKNLAGGIATEPAYKEGSLYQAVLLSAGAEINGDIALCEITVGYAADSAKAERVLTVEQVQVITDLRAETMLTLGPTPPAATMTLASDETLLTAPAFWPLVAGLAALALIALVVILIRRSRRSRHRHHRAPTQRRLRTQAEHAPAHTATSH
jgi:hypothetical protein